MCAPAAASGSRADLVVDAMGRRSAAAEAARRRPATRRPRTAAFSTTRASSAARLPELRGAPLTPLGTFSILTLPGDAGTWSLTLFASARDQPLKRLRDVDALDGARRAPARSHAHWLDGEPITGVMAMGGVIDRYRSPAPAPGS